jgi:hypothetical protein
LKGLVKLHWAYPSAFLNKCVKEREAKILLFLYIYEIIFLKEIMIYKASILIVGLLYLEKSLVAQSPNQTQKNNVVVTYLKIQESLWNEGNIDGFMKFYWHSDSLKFIGSKGITYGWQKTLDNYKKSYPNKTEMGILKFTILSNVQISENYIYLIGKWQLTKEKPVEGHFTLLWKKIKGQWLIIADHTS